MLDASEAKELIDDAIERAEDRDARAERAARKFRDRLSLLVALFAVALAIVHLLGAGALRDNVVDTIRASDAYNYMQAKKLRQVVLQTGALTAPAAQAGQLLAEARSLDRPGDGHAISALQKSAAGLEHAAAQAGETGERYEWSETALQVAIVLLSIAMIATSRAVATGACAVAAVGVAIALLTYGHVWP